MTIPALFFLLAMQFQGHQFGDYVLTTVPHGLTITSLVRNREFLLGLNGDEIAALKAVSPGRLAVMVDKKFLQVFSVPLGDFNGTAASSDLAVQRQYMEFKARSITCR